MFQSKAGDVSRAALLLALSLPACSRRSGPDPARIFTQANALRERGDFEQALSLANQGFSQSCQHPESDECWRFRLLKAEVLISLGRIPEASQLLQAVSSLPGKPDLEAWLLLDQGYAEYKLTHLAESKALFDRSVQLAESGQAWPLVAEIKLRRGAVLSRLGDAAAEEADFVDALRLARQANDRYLEMSGLANLAKLLQDKARYDEAAASFEQLRDVAGPLQSKSFAARLLNNLGYCYLQLGLPERAAPLFEQAQKLAEQTGALTDEQIALGHSGDMFNGQGQYSRALSYYQRALDVARKSHDQRWVVKWLCQMVDASLETGDLTHAEAYNREAVALEAQIDSPGERLRPELNRASITEAKRQFDEAEDLYRSVVRAAERLAGTQEPGLLLEARGRLATLLVEMHRAPAAEAEFRAALALINSTRAALQQDEYRITFFSSLLDFYQEYVDFLMAQHRPLDALRVAESSRARVLAEKLGEGPPAARRSSAYDYRKLARASRTVLLSYWLAPRRSFLWVITPAKVTAFQLPAQSEIQSLLSAYSGAIEQLRDPVRDDSDVGRQLHQAILAPAESLIPPGSSVAVVPDGALHNLNFATVPAGGPQAHYWIDDVSLSVLPSLDLVYRRTSGEQSQPRSLLLIGDPVPPDQRAFPRLPQAASEIDGIERQFSGSVVRAGAAAAPQAYAASKPDEFAVIHFAAHAEANSEDPLDSAIILSPQADRYKLYARDVVSLPIHADLVTISACRGAGSRAYAGEGLVGFAWAFLQAGARNVVAGLWEVDDRSTAELMEKMYSGLRNGMSPQEALRKAQLVLLQSDGSYRKPYYWAPFQVITDTLAY